MCIFPTAIFFCSADCSSAECSLQTSGGLAIENHFFWWLCVLLGLHFTGIHIHVLGPLHRLSPLIVITTLHYQCYLLPPALEMRKLRLREVEWKRGLNPGLIPKAMSDLSQTFHHVCVLLSWTCPLPIKIRWNLMEFWQWIIFVL